MVNIIWGSAVTDNPDPKGVVDAANFLRAHLLKKQYKEDLVTNYTVNEKMTIVFRGRDKKNRMVLLTLKIPKAKNTKDKKKASKDFIDGEFEDIEEKDDRKI